MDLESDLEEFLFERACSKFPQILVAHDVRFNFAPAPHYGVRT